MNNEYIWRKLVSKDSNGNNLTKGMWPYVINAEFLFNKGGVEIE